MTMGYPHTQAGWKGNKPPGIKAAFAVSRDLGRRHSEFMSALTPYGAPGASCDVLSETTGLPAYLLRPRATELEKQGKIFAVGKAMGMMGHKVTVYSTVRPRVDEHQGGRAFG